jgi:hypothetical protein
MNSSRMSIHAAFLVTCLALSHDLGLAEDNYCPPTGSRASQRRELNRRAMGREIAPPGTSLHAIFSTQIANGRAARMMLYRYDFITESDRLSPRGYWQLTKLARQLEYHSFPLLIEPTHSTELDQARRDYILAVLADSAIPVDADRVITARPLTRGLDGVDAMQLYPGLLRLSEGGSTGGGAGGSTSSGLSSEAAAP